MKKTIFPLALGIVTVLSVKCSIDKNAKIGNDINSDYVQNIQLPQFGADTLKTSYFVDTVIYIPLETTPTSLLGSIRQIWTDDSIILVDSWKSGLCLFGKDGRFIRRIGKMGNGPGEYLSIFHFDVIHDTIYVSSTNRKGFLRYTFEGKFCNEINLNYQPVVFTTTSNQKMACYIQAEGKILVYNASFQSPDTIIVDYGVTIGRYKWGIYNYDFQPYLQKGITGLFYNNYRTDTIWQIKGNSKEPAYILNLNNELLPFDKQVEFSQGDFKKWDQMVQSFRYVHLIPYKSLVLVLMSRWGVSTSESPLGYEAIYIVNNNTGETKKFNTSYFFDDIVSKLKIPEKRSGCIYTMVSENYIVSAISPSNVLDHIEKVNIGSENAPSTKWIEQMSSINEDDNPILVLMIVKKNL